jgi:beta-ureidopropionase / N-carbamoyl-L-amino-acid hydrolase
MIDGARLLDRLATLARVGATPAGGVNRPAYSDDDLSARSLVREMMRDAGLAVRVDSAGNSIGARSGESNDLPPIVIGSHTDTVIDGGRFDGALGVLAAIEVARAVGDRGIALRHPLEVANFQNEEGGLIGSKIVAGRFATDALTLRAASGYTIGEGIVRLGGDVARLDEARRAPGSIDAYLELHIEQGCVLEDGGADIGIVQGIVGIWYWRVVVEGTAAHSGTTPMSGRRDALLAASRVVDAVNRVVTARPGPHVGTVGRLAVSPNAANVIPGRVELTLELRDIDAAVVTGLFADIERQARAIGGATGTTITLSPTLANEPSLAHERVQRAAERAAASLGLRALYMPSGAGHDAQNMAVLGPAGMVFVPSVGGISHSPAEYTRDADVVNGAEVLLAAVLELDADD